VRIAGRRFVIDRFVITCIDASTFSSMPVAKKLEISAAGSPETRCA